MPVAMFMICSDCTCTSILHVNIAIKVIDLNYCLANNLI